MDTEGPKVWVSVSSHRARAKLLRLTGEIPSYGSWPEGELPRGEYYEIPQQLTAGITRIKGVQVLKHAPKDIFKRWTSK